MSFGVCILRAVKARPVCHTPVSPHRPSAIRSQVICSHSSDRLSSSRQKPFQVELARREGKSKSKGKRDKNQPKPQEIYVEDGVEEGVEDGQDVWDSQMDAVIKSLMARRHVLVCGSLWATSLSLTTAGARAASEEYALNLGEYANAKDGYKLAYPADWKVSSKAGASVLYEDPAQKYNTVGVLAYPVRIRTLEQFGSLEFAAQKLLDVENKKEITQSSKLLNTREFDMPKSGLAYEIEYEVTTDYGTKINVALVTVANSKLYNLNVQYGRTGFYGGASDAFIGSIRQVLDSFALL